MRIIAGEFRHRTLLTPPDDAVTRPIPDRVKESLFSMLRGNCEGVQVFDGFAGTGALGLEAISRGASHCMFVERDKHVAEILRKNVRALGAEDRCDVVHGDCLGVGALARAPRPLGLVFLDPPYPLVAEAGGYARVMAQLRSLVDLLADDGFAVLRTPWPLQHASGSPASAEDVAPEPDGKSSGRADARVKPRRKGKGEHDWKRRLRDLEHEREGTSPRRTPTRQELESDAPDEDLLGENLDDNAWHNVSEDADMDVEVVDLDQQQAKVPLTDADLSLSNAMGPETHVYRGMAVHLYMRKR